MADIELTLDGDSTGAVKALDDTGKATGELSKASAKAWKEIGDYAKTAATVVAAFGAASVKAFMEADRVQKQLVRAAGEHAEALGAQADAMERLFAVDGEVIKQSQTLLTQWGGVGAASEEVTRAILDYAAATGTDAVAATQDLIRNVESGGTGLAKLGVHFDATGDKGEDLSRAVEALGKKFGGAAGADAEGLHGQVSAVGLAFERLQEDIGESIAAMANQAGVASKLVEILGALDEFAFNKQGAAHEKASSRATAWVQAQLELTNAQQAMSEAATSGDVSKTVLAMFLEDVDRAQAKVDALKASAAPLLPGMDTVGGPTNKAMKEQDAAAAAHATKTAAEQKKNAEDWKTYLQGIDDLEETARKQDEERYADELALSAKRVDLAIKEGDDKTAALQLSITKDNELYEKQVKYRNEAAARLQKEATESNDQATRRQEQAAAATGDAIGAAFVNSLTAQLEKLAEGGEFDTTVFIGDILASTFAIAASAIGTAAGNPALGAAIGNLGALGIRAGASAASGYSKRKNASKQYHDGGWVGDEPRFHSGAWIGGDEQRAILQTGERVLSRKEVHHMGGSGAVDNMARGGPSMVVQIHAIDSKSAANSFETDLGKGMRRAQRSGRGDLPSLLGEIPR